MCLLIGYFGFYEKSILICFIGIGGKDTLSGSIGVDEVYFRLFFLMSFFGFWDQKIIFTFFKILNWANRIIFGMIFMFYGSNRIVDNFIDWFVVIEAMKMCMATGMRPILISFFDFWFSFIRKTNFEILFTALMSIDRMLTTITDIGLDIFFAFVVFLILTIIVAT